MLTARNAGTAIWQGWKYPSLFFHGEAESNSDHLVEMRNNAKSTEWSIFCRRDCHETGREEPADPPENYGLRPGGVQAAGIQRQLCEQYLHGGGRIQGHYLPLFPHEGRTVSGVRGRVLSAPDAVFAGASHRSGQSRGKAAGALLCVQDGFFPQPSGVSADLL